MGATGGNVGKTGNEIIGAVGAIEATNAGDGTAGAGGLTGIAGIKLFKLIFGMLVGKFKPANDGIEGTGGAWILKGFTVTFPVKLLGLVGELGKTVFGIGVFQLELLLSPDWATAEPPNNKPTKRKSFINILFILENIIICWIF